MLKGFAYNHFIAKFAGFYKTHIRSFHLTLVKRIIFANGIVCSREWIAM